MPNPTLCVTQTYIRIAICEFRNFVVCQPVQYPIRIWWLCVRDLRVPEGCELRERSCNQCDLRRPRTKRYRQRTADGAAWTPCLTPDYSRKITLAVYGYWVILTECICRIKGVFEFLYVTDWKFCNLILL